MKRRSNRFIIIGIINTSIDFILLFTFVHLGLSTVISNIISTSTALIFSFFANRTYTFKSQDKLSLTQIILFLVITLVGLWLIQPLIIQGVYLVFHHTFSSKSLLLLLGKLFATCFTLVWNYVLYGKFVFKTKHKTLDETLSHAA